MDSLIIGKIGGKVGNGKTGFPSVEIPFGGLLGWIRGEIGNDVVAAKIANNRFAAVASG